MVTTYLIEIPCSTCGKPRQVKLKGYCSGACKVKAHRDSEKIELAWSSATSSVKDKDEEKVWESTMGACASCGKRKVVVIRSVLWETERKDLLLCDSCWKNAQRDGAI